MIQNLEKSSFNNHTDGIKPNHSSINMDGNPAKSCINPLPNGQTGKLYQVEELDQWRAHARAFMVERQPHWPDTKKKTKGKKSKFYSCVFHKGRVLLRI